MLTAIEQKKCQALARDILAAVLADETLKTIDNFGDLHDHCDANCLAGLCEEGHWLHSEKNELEMLNEAQTIVNNALGVLNHEIDSKVLSFEEFQGLRQYVSVDDGSNAAEELAAQDIEGEAYVYSLDGALTFIEKFPREERFSLTLDRSIYESEDLAELEGLLYEFVIEELGYVKP